MTKEQQQRIAEAYREGNLHPARAMTSEVTHQRVGNDRTAICGAKVSRSGGGVRHCDNCMRRMPS